MKTIEWAGKDGSRTACHLREHTCSYGWLPSSFTLWERFSSSKRPSSLITIQIRLERAVDGDADVRSLLFGKFGELHAEAGEVQAGHFLVELLGQRVHFTS